MEKSFEILLHEHRSMMLSYASMLLSGDADEAEDVVQEASLTAYSKLEDFEQGRSFPKWIRGIIRYKVLESRRQTQRRPLPQDPEVIAGIDEVYAMFDAPGDGAGPWGGRLEVIKLCVAQLKAPMREVIERFYQSGCSMKEISAQLSINAVTVGKRLSRSRTLIRSCVASRMRLEDL